jgi:superfamily I DNA and RNA helicase
MVLCRASERDTVVLELKMCKFKCVNKRNTFYTDSVRTRPDVHVMGGPFIIHNKIKLYIVSCLA